MRKKLFMATAVCVTMFSTSTQIVNAATISQFDTITAQIQSVNGNTLVLRPIRNVYADSYMNRREIALNPHDVIHATVQPLKPGNTRTAVCVDKIAQADVTNLYKEASWTSFPHQGCVGQLHDLAGAAGVPTWRIRPGEKVTIFLNGDLTVAR